MLLLFVEVHPFLVSLTFSLKKFRCLSEFDSKMFFFFKMGFGKTVEWDEFRLL